MFGGDFQLSLVDRDGNLIKSSKVPLSFIGFEFKEMIDKNDGSDHQENIDLLYSAISNLNEVEKAVVMLYLDDKSYEEMEEVLGISMGTLRVKMNRIKEKLRQITKTSQYGT